MIFGLQSRNQCRPRFESRNFEMLAADRHVPNRRQATRPPQECTMSEAQLAELARKKAEIEEKRKNLERLRAEAAKKDKVDQLAQLERRKSDLLEKKKDIAAKKAENEKAMDFLQKTLSSENLSSLVNPPSTLTAPDESKGEILFMNNSCAHSICRQQNRLIERQTLRDCKPNSSNKRKRKLSSDKRRRKKESSEGRRN